MRATGMLLSEVVYFMPKKNCLRNMKFFKFKVVIVILKVQLNRYDVMLVILYEHGQFLALQ